MFNLSDDITRSRQLQQSMMGKTCRTVLFFEIFYCLLIFYYETWILSNRKWLFEPVQCIVGLQWSLQTSQFIELVSCVWC